MGSLLQRFPVIRYLQQSAEGDLAELNEARGQAVPAVRRVDSRAHALYLQQARVGQLITRDNRHYTRGVFIAYYCASNCTYASTWPHRYPYDSRVRRCRVMLGALLFFRLTRVTISGYIVRVCIPIPTVQRAEDSCSCVRRRLQRPVIFYSRLSQSSNSAESFCTDRSMLQITM